MGLCTSACEQDEPAAALDALAHDFQLYEVYEVWNPDEAESDTGDSGTPAVNPEVAFL
jgi:hypothetical protein